MEIIEAKKLAEEKIKDHEIDYEVAFNNRKTQLGLCNTRTKKIYLSALFVKLNDINIVRNTILHEIAHALTPGHGHDKVWRDKCIEIGALPNRINRIAIAPKCKYTGTCPNCKREFQYNRIRNVSCGVCDKKFNPLYRITYKLNQ